MSFFCFKLLKQCPFISHVYILLIYVDIYINVLYFLYIYVNVQYIICLLYLFEGVGYCGVYSLLPAHLCCVLLCVLARVRGRSSTSLGFDYNMPRSQKRYSHSHIACSSLRATRTHTFSTKALCLHHDTGNDCPASCFSTDETEEQSSCHNAFTVNTHKR